MRTMRQTVAVLLFILIMTGSFAAVQARVIDHVPVILPSVDAAVTSLNQLSLKTDRNAMYLSDGSITFAAIRRVSLQNTGLDMINIWVERADGSPLKFIHSKDTGLAMRVADAVWTLALAANAPLEPYFDFILYHGTPADNSQLKEKLQAGGAAAGAVVLREPLAGYLKHGDIITEASFGGKTVPIDSEVSWLAACREALADKKTAVITAGILRTGTRLNQEVKVTNVGFGVKLDGGKPEGTPGGQSAGLGLMLQALSEDEAKALGLPSANGFLVLGVRQGSPAERLKIKPDDVLLALNGVDITSTAQLQELAKGPLASAKVFRGGSVLFLTAPLVI